MRLAGKKAVIVGAASPIGMACSRRFTREGASILAVDRDRNGLIELCDQIGVEQAIHLVADQSTEDGIGLIVNMCRERWAAVDILLNCSGIVDFWDDGAETLGLWAEVFRVNLFGPAFLARALLPLMTRNSRSSVIFLGSVDGTRGNPTLPAYSASKGGLVPLTHVLADEWASMGVRVNCLATALIYHHGPSDPFPSKPATDFEKLRQVTPLRRKPAPEEIATAALFLASDDSSYMTGDVITLDGGRTAITPGTSRY
jgi:NAD(P)-dependent dehydrogenase (short-subunit alcohol dehydrogenase family)